MNKFEEFLTYKCLNYKLHTPTLLLDHAIESGGIEADFPTQNVCAKLSVDLVVELNNVCDVLGVSKRSFIESALTNALEKFDEVAARHDIFVNDLPEKEGVA